MKTVRVRIPVLVNTDGFWVSGCVVRGEKDDRHTLDFLVDSMPDDSHTGKERLVYVEADVPVPEIETVEGQVSE